MAKSNNVYVVNGEEKVSTLAEVAKVLGVSRVSKKDVEEGKYDVVVEEAAVSLADTEEVVEEVVTEEEDILEGVEVVEDEEEEEAAEDVEEPTSEEDSEDEWEEGYPVATEVEEDEDEEIEYPEVGDFEDEKAIKKYIKGLTDEQLQAWCELEGAEWVENEHRNINRMRMAMAIKAVHFPELAKKPSSKKKSKYAEYTTEELVEMAIDNNVEVRDDKGNERILRMYTIIALREAGLIS
ncbi:gp44 [Bacillus phage SPO1]|uniref:E3 protein n=3 Tax=Okubovirus SPO1 TaxID=10685 RepID=GP44_BPSP1|nr:transcriptional regulator [Bacillus phage SPO1]Q08402.1 RecName: Full=E3 protein; AltName: Full=Gene 44 protein [Bacillus phage SPO1]AAA16199.1 e3 protein [Bacillus phage SPO1]AAC29013.1 E3 [Bacillus phage SPO1]ACI90917.1 gp44 [Bacillus phage SPO1]